MSAPQLPDLSGLVRRLGYTRLLKAGFAIGIIGLSFYFIRREGVELIQAFGQISQSPIQWAVYSGLVSLAYLLLSAGMYMAGFASAGGKVSLTDALTLFLKRNVFSVFLPAGGLSSLAFFNRSLTQKGITASQNYAASAVYTIVSFGSLLILAFPVLLWLGWQGKLTGVLTGAFVILSCLLGGIIWIWSSWNQQGVAFGWLNRYVPSLVRMIEPLRGPTIRLPLVWLALLLSTGVELCGIAHLWLALNAIGYQTGLGVALFGYIIATLLYAVSPFMRGIGLVELSLTFTLIQYGIPELPAVSITLYYRFFEFWLPLLLGLGAFIARKDNLLLRVFPAVLVMAMGIINILSALTPALPLRVALLAHFLSDDTMRLSYTLVIGLGVGLVFLSLYLIRGLQNAWWLTVLIVALSIVGHLTKAIDYEEALFGCLVLSVLVYTRQNYILSSNRSEKRLKLSVLFLVFFGLLLYGYGLLGLWWLKTTGAQFLAGDAVNQLNQLLILQPAPYLPKTNQAYGFSGTLQWMELGWLAGLFYTFIKPVLDRPLIAEGDRDKATLLIYAHGRSSLDYFKSYIDKEFFFNPQQDGFIAFRTVGRYAVVLESPVAPNEAVALDTIRAFDKYCHHRGQQSLYYRVDGTELAQYESLGKKHVFIGQEGIITLSRFSLEGPDRKSLRNILRKVQTSGFITRTHKPPLTEELLQQLQVVSDQWLSTPGKQESGFSQGVFLGEEIRQQVVVTIEDANERVVAFANIIPDFAPGEATYDLIRKTDDAPGGAMDALLVEMISYARVQGKQYLNIGMAPFSGIETPHTLPEIGMKFAYDHLNQLAHFKGLRFFKDKYADLWTNKYLIYNQDLDLVQVPQVLTRVSLYEPTKLHKPRELKP